MAVQLEILKIARAAFTEAKILSLNYTYGLVFTRLIDWAFSNQENPKAEFLMAHNLDSLPLPHCLSPNEAAYQ